jgi:nicotinate-nucleotide pyrophosphorylase (carboxylating)
MSKEFHQSTWNDDLKQDWLRILELAIREDLGNGGDCTTEALVPNDAEGRAAIVVRQAGVLAGEAAITATLAAFDPGLNWSPLAADGAVLTPRQSIGVLHGPARAMLAAERPLLNMLGRLSGVASLTRRYVAAVAGTRAAIYDTRKTTPGWRTLEKYAVRCGGGRNHRGGLSEAVLIKDNHLALGKLLKEHDPRGFTVAEAVVRARDYLQTTLGREAAKVIVEVEVDTLEQFETVLASRPDIILLDNMAQSQLAEAVARRDLFLEALHAAIARVGEMNLDTEIPGLEEMRIELEASGGIDLETIRAVAETGVERISVGALTHSAVSLDFGLDWN